jgi:hypothetical protein
VDAVDRADVDAGEVFDVDAGSAMMYVTGRLLYQAVSSSTT